MLNEFITDNRDEIIARARARVTDRTAPRATKLEIDGGIPLFLTQIAELLKETLTEGEQTEARGALAATAVTHGRHLLVAGLTIGQVVHDYGDVCQVVTELAMERHVPIAAAEFRAFNRCLDDAIAQAVGEYTRLHDRSIAANGAVSLVILGQELRNVLSSAMLAWDAVRRGAAGTGGNVAAVLTGSLVQMREVIDRSLAEVRLDSATIALERVVLADFIEGEEIAASIHARAHGIELSVAPIDLGLTVLIDPQVLASALANLLHNAFKLTRLHTRVKLTARGTDTRVYIEVEDECGGLPPGAAQNLLCLAELPRARGPRAGVGLRRAIRAVEANGGHLHVKDLPGQGCRFTIDLPRLAPGNTAPTKTNGVPS